MVKRHMREPSKACRFLAFRLLLVTGVGLSLSGSVFAQTSPPLTLTRALELAKSRNGDVRSAIFDLRAADSRVKQAFAAFLPIVTPVYRYTSARQESATYLGGHFIQTEGGSTTIDGSWRVLDTGERDLTYRSSKRSFDAQRLITLQTLRTTLFSVEQQYYEALRAQELQSVSDAEVDRTKLILEQTRARVELKDAAAKDILQAEADALNAQVSSLLARNRSTNAQATLKATLGLPSGEPLPVLEAVPVPELVGPEGELDSLLSEGVRNRPDLISRRKLIDAQKLNLERARRGALVSLGVDLNYSPQITPKYLQDRSFLLTASIPLFDGGRSREQAREINANVQSSLALLEQSERVARSEIETAYKDFGQNAERAKAAQAALTAAKKNYEAASDSQKAGASNLIEVITARVSLVTAESNFVEALYDYTISDVKLRLVLGRPIPGE